MSGIYTKGITGEGATGTFSVRWSMPEQFEYILTEIEKRCPNAVRGEVYKKK